MNCELISRMRLFRDVSAEEIGPMLGCLQVHERSFRKGERILSMGDAVQAAGLVLSGEVFVEHTDVWGVRSILATVGAGNLFAEAYACVPERRSMVDVVAARDCAVLFLNVDRILRLCPSACPCHTRLVRNLLADMAEKNLNLTNKIAHTAPKSIRARVLAYLSSQAQMSGAHDFTIPFSRQELADYLNVDRSALSAELGKMQREGLLEFRKNRFSLNRTTFDTAAPPACVRART